MWGNSIIGFGDRHLKYESGRELDWLVMGFSPRKQNLTLYIYGTMENQQEFLKKFGKHKTGKGCLLVSKPEDVDLAVLKEIIKKGIVKQDRSPLNKPIFFKVFHKRKNDLNRVRRMHFNYPDLTMQMFSGIL